MDHATTSLRGTPARLVSLDLLRGLSALAVFLTHWHAWPNLAPHGAVELAVRHALEWLYAGFGFLAWPTGGHHPAVVAFFVISGFCIHYPFERRARRDGTTPNRRDYFVRRFRRVMPVYWTGCALGLLLVALEHFSPSGDPEVHIHTAATAGEVALRLTAATGLFPRELYTGNCVLAMVTVEMVFYVTYPWFFHFAQRGRWVALGAFFVGLQFVAVALLAWVSPFWVFNSPLMFGLFFYLGALVAHLFLTGARASVLWLPALWGLFIVLKVTPHFYGLNLIKQAVWALVCGVGIWLAVTRETRRPYSDRNFLVRALRSLGDVSYSLYATHTPSIMFATWLLAHFGAAYYGLQLVVSLLITGVVTVAVHRGVERRFYRSPLREPASLEQRLPRLEPDVAATRAQL